MLDLNETVARHLFVRFGKKRETWEALPVEDRHEFRFAAHEILASVAAAAPFEPEALVAKIRETRPTRLGFLYMAYTLNNIEAAALLVIHMGRANPSRTQDSAAAEGPPAAFAETARLPLEEKFLASHHGLVRMLGRAMRSIGRVIPLAHHQLGALSQLRAQPAQVKRGQSADRAAHRSSPWW
jgi:hypothetical protein